MGSSQHPKSYSRISRLIHWVTALCVLGLIFVGYQMKLMDYSEFKFQVFGLHKSFGLLVLALVIFRILWHQIVKKPKSLPSHRLWETILAHAAHGFLYAAMFILPLSGWIMSSAGEFPVQFFGYHVPPIVGKNPDLARSAEEVHGVVALILVFVLGLHLMGAVKHHLIDRDKTITRMVSSKIGFKGGFVVCVIAIAAYVVAFYGYADKELLRSKPPRYVEKVEEQVQSDVGVLEEDLVQSSAKHWDIIKDQSTLIFKATQYGTEFSGTFDFDGEIYFDLDDMSYNKVAINIDITSINTGDDGRDSQAKGDDWFKISAFPKAIFTAERFDKTEAGYHAYGTLDLRGVRSEVSFPFTLQHVDGKDSTLRMAASLDLSRLTFGIGQGEWKSEDAIGDNVAILIDLYVR